MAENRQTAIALLGKRRDVEVSRKLANLLQPYENLGTRKAIADALFEGGCSIPCIRLVLHYRERIWRGEPDSEERIPPVSTFVISQRAAINEKLNQTLLKQPDLTLSVLQSTYGLGSDDPSPFALALVEELKLKNACGSLIHSQEAGSKLVNMGYIEPVELSHVIAKLECAHGQ
jgi:hypothetical protein